MRVGHTADTVSHTTGRTMAPQNDELSSHRTRTNRRPEPAPSTAAATAVLEPGSTADDAPR
jgi:hypothetical protein